MTATGSRRRWSSSCKAAGGTTAAALALGSVLALGGCSIVSPMPLWELSKAGAAVVSTSLSFTAGSASQSVRHEHVAYRGVCIEFNRDCQVSDLLPALQAELHARRLRSRVLEAGLPESATASCEVWLKYEGYLQWDTPMWRDQPQAYLERAALSLLRPDGRVVAAGRYESDGALPLGRWAGTRQKIAPLVAAVVDGKVD